MKKLILFLSIISASGLVMITIYNLVVDAAAFFLYAIIAVLTFLYFVPRDEIIFNSPIENTGRIQMALSEWKQMNWIRTFLGLVGVLCTFKGLDIFYKLKASG